MEGLEHYRGLVYKTAMLVVGTVEDDFDDVVQVLYIKAWYAVRKYEDGRSRMNRDRFVFMCLRNQVKDLQKRRRRGELSLEALVESEGSLGFQSRDSFDAKYLAGEEAGYELVEEEPLLLPNTLTEQERDVALALTAGYEQAEVRAALGIEKREMERVMKSIRTKLADWRPTAAAPADVMHLPARREVPTAIAA